VLARLGRGASAKVAAGALIAGLFAGLAGPAAYAVTPLASAVNGTNPTAGPETGDGFGRMGGRFPGGFPGGPGGPGAQPPGQTGQAGQTGQIPQGQAGENGQPGTRRVWGRGGPDGEVDNKMISYLKANRGGATWLVAVSSARGASSIILSTGEPVIAMGGFTGSDPAMTVAKLKEYVSSGKLKYVLVGGGMGGPERGDDEVTAWVQKNGTAVDAAAYGGTAGANQTLYRLG
jgi:hypothetical protein